MNEPAPAAPAPLLRLEEAAALLGISPRTAKAWRARGEFPPALRLTGHTLRWIAGDVHAWAAARRECTQPRTIESRRSARGKGESS